MSEIVFILHLVTLIFLGLVALRLGKETLTAFSALQAILANLFIQKQTYLFGLEVTCTDAYAILSLFSLNLVQEYFGKDAAKRVIKINFFLLLTFAIMAKIHLLPPRFTMKPIVRSLLYSKTRPGPFSPPLQCFF